jgi:asparagine synthase (glutamine-hydrolysing)
MLESVRSSGIPAEKGGSDASLGLASLRTPAEKLPGRCGICGIFEYSGEERASRPLVEAMANSIRHRGPDDDGYHVEGPIGMGFRRLSIIDLAGGHQPNANEDSTCWLTLNGEIYKYHELRQQIQDAGHQMLTRADS